MNRTNIVFMHSHNTGRFVQPYGHAVPTPHLQRLAGQGVLFRQAFAAAPTCSPSRASFLTGMYPHSCGQFGLAHRGFSMPDYSRHLVHGMKRAGYHTVLSGVEHTAPDLAVVGYDEVVCDHDTNYPATEPADAADAAAAFIRRRHPKPFFISVGLNETHRPFPRADPVQYPAEDERFCQPPAPLPDTPSTRRDTADFKAAARVMDAAFARVLRALDDAGLADDTLVLCFTDHGLQFPRNMCNLTDQGIGVFLVARGPGGFRGGQVIDALVSLIDLAPTAYAAAGIDVPDFVEGRPLQPLVRGEADTLHEEIHAEINYHAAYEPARCLRTERYKYIRRYDDYRRVVLSNADDGPSKDELLSRGWDALPREREMLYDLVFDPTEQSNVVARPDLRPVAADLRARLDRWMATTGDPLLAGSVDAPAGARITHAMARSPADRSSVILEATFGRRVVPYGHVLLDHVQVGMPPGREDAVRAFYGAALGLNEIPKPAPLAARGGVWYAVGDQEIHLGVAEDFLPAKKAHPAFRVPDAAAVAERLRDAGFSVRWDSALPGCSRFFTDDPFGNRIEILSRGTDRQMEDRAPLTGFPLIRSTLPITEEDVRSLEDRG